MTSKPSEVRRLVNPVGSASRSWASPLLCHPDTVRPGHPSTPRRAPCRSHRQEPRTGTFANLLLGSTASASCATRSACADRPDESRAIAAGYCSLASGLVGYLARLLCVQLVIFRDPQHLLLHPAGHSLSAVDSAHRRPADRAAHHCAREAGPRHKLNMVIGPFSASWAPPFWLSCAGRWWRRPR